MSNLVKNFIVIFLTLFLVAGLMSYGASKDKEPEPAGIHTLIAEISQGEVKRIEVRDGDTLLVTLKDESKKQQAVKKEFSQSFSELMENYQISPETLAGIEVEVKEPEGWKFWLGALAPYVLPFLLIAGLLFFMTRQGQGINNRAMGFGQSTARQVKPEDRDKNTFADVAGAKEAKEELQEVVEFL